MTVSAVTSEPNENLDSETLFRRHAQFVAGFLYRLGARDADLEDLVQDVFVTAHRKGGYQAGAASPTTFLARLCLEARLSSKRRNHRWQLAHGQDLSVQLSGADPHTPEHSLATLQAALRMQQALDAMEPTTRAVFVLYELEGQGCDAIAAGLEMKVGTVYSRLHAARKAFRDHVSRDERRSDRPLPLLAGKTS